MMIVVCQMLPKKPTLQDDRMPIDPDHLLQFIAPKSKVWKKIALARSVNALCLPPSDPSTACHVVRIERTWDTSTNMTLPAQRLATDHIFTISTMIIFKIATGLLLASLDLIIRRLKRCRNHAL